MKIKIEDLPKDIKISHKGMKTVMGGIIGDFGLPNPFTYNMFKYTSPKPDTNIKPSFRNIIK